MLTSQVSRGEFGTFNPVRHVAFEFAEAGAERGGRRDFIGEYEGEARTKQAVIGASEEEREAQAVRGDLVAAGLGNATNEPVEAEAS